MTKRSRRLLLATIAGLAALAVAGWLLWPQTVITRENAERIKVGMTLAEVETILGGPARDDTTGPVECIGDSTRTRRLFRPQQSWQSDEVMIVVMLDAESRVFNYFSVPIRRVPESPLATIRRWLHL